MSKPQIFRVTATPRERFRLSQVLLSEQLKFRRKSAGQLARARAALCLVGVTEMGTRGKRVSTKPARDQTTRNRFSVSAETAAFILEQLDKVDLSSFDAMVLQPLIEQLEAGTDVADADAAADLVDDAAELERWKPDPRPLLEDPEHFIEVLGELLKRADGDLRRLADLYADAMAAPPDKEEDEPGE